MTGWKGMPKKKHTYPERLLRECNLIDPTGATLQEIPLLESRRDFVRARAADCRSYSKEITSREEHGPC